MLDRQLSARTGLALLILSLLGLSGLVAFLLGGEGAAPPGETGSVSPRGTVSDAAVAGFVGDQACASCHPAIFQTHRGSRHAATLHPMRPGHLPVSLPDHAQFADRATGLEYALERRKDRYFFRVLTPGEPQAQPIEFAFGSGKTGITFVSMAGDDAIRELRMSYFPFRHRWEVTPGQRGPAADPLGALHEGPVAQRCFGCHATVIPASRVLPEPKFMGVGCEACHGPGRRHIEAMQRGDPDRRIDNPGRWDGKRVNDLCGRCHRTEQDLDPMDRFSLAQTQRFQPIGLARSACFRGSDGHLTCVTCHDAHEDASRSPAHYEAICLSCHAGKAGAPVHSVVHSGYSAKSTAGSSLPDTEYGLRYTPERLNGRVCPVNPRTGCITCHMPNREVVRGISMADHWIRIFPSSAAGGRQR